MKTSARKFRLPALALTAAVMIAGCPLPYEYNGPGTGTSHTTDPSSPSITAPVTVSYSVQGGPSGTVGDGASFYAGDTMTVTLSTATVSSFIFYTDNGTPLSLSSLGSVKKISASSGEITITRATSLQSLDIRAIAIGPNMLPSAAVHATLGVSPYPILSITRDNAFASEDGGTATFTITSSSAPASDITVNLATSGDYEPGDVTGLPASGLPLSLTLLAGATTISLPITGQPDTDLVDDTVTLTLQAGSTTPPVYTVGAPASASVVIQDNQKPTYTVTYNGNGNTGGTAPTDGNGYHAGDPVTALLNSGGLVKTGYSFAGWNTQAGGNGTTYAPNQTFTMGGANLVLYAKWGPRTATILADFAWVGTGQRPEAIAYDGTSLWVGDVNESKVYRINPSDGSAISSFSLGTPGPTHALALDGAGEIWTTTFWTDPPALYRFPMTFVSPDRTLTLPTTMSYPTGMTFDPTNNVFWVVNTNSPANPSHFWKLDANGSVIDSWDLSGGTPYVYGLCMDSDPNYLWMVAGNSLSRISIAGRQVVETYPIAGADLLQGVTMVSPDTFWLVSGNNKRLLKVQLQ